MTGPRILLLDIETQPDLVWTWGVYEQNAISVKEHWQLLSFSAEWLGGKNITKGLCDYKGYKAGCSDKHLVSEIWELLNDADIVVAHNGASFDLRKLNARFIALGLPPTSPYGVVDTRREISRVAGFSSNKLDWLAKQLDLGSKLEHEGFPMWLGCMAGDKKSWKKMKKYNRHDVVLLKRLYKLISPWIRQPNANMWANDGKEKDGLTYGKPSKEELGKPSNYRPNLANPICTNPACGGRRLKSTGYVYNKTLKYKRFKCVKCGRFSRSTKSEHYRISVV